MCTRLVTRIHFLQSSPILFQRSTSWSQRVPPALPEYSSSVPWPLGKEVLPQRAPPVYYMYTFLLVKPHLKLQDLPPTSSEAAPEITGSPPTSSEAAPEITGSPSYVMEICTCTRSLSCTTFRHSNKLVELPFNAKAPSCLATKVQSAKEHIRAAALMGSRVLA